ncbi:LCP family protein [Streptomyces sp. NPDC015220]|uniref:LCP family protein n=1 Tax=Streptomyces sp. NPDC015220 TaxID=3364947 RepID=UPI0036F816BC
MPKDRAGTAAGPGLGASATGTGLRLRRRRNRLRGGALGLAVLLAGGTGAGLAAYTTLSGNITSDEAAAAELRRYERERPTALVKGAQNILLIGSDTRSGTGDERYGRDLGTERSDTVILLHLAADRRGATAVSLPRDLMVRVPSCHRPDGSSAEAALTALNRAYETGGSACTVRTVEKLTGIRIDHHLVVDFNGFKELVDAVDGVQVCLRAPVDDQEAGLRLPAGRVRLDGEQALGYVRARKSLGDGSDTDRMERQQRLLGALLDKARRDDVLLNPSKLYPVLNAATSSLTADPALASLRGLYQLVRGLRDIPTERVRFLTVPRKAYVHDANRDQLMEPDAGKLFARLRADEPVEVVKRTPGNSGTKGGNSSAAGTAAPSRPTAPAAASASRPASASTSASASAESNSPSEAVPAAHARAPHSFTQSGDYVRYVFESVPKIGAPGAAFGSPPAPVPTFTGSTASQDPCG